MKEHIYTLNISDEHPNSITLPVYFFHHTPHHYIPSFGLRHVASEEVKIHYSFTREIIIGNTIAEKLLLPHSTTIHAFHTKTKRLFFFRTINRDFHNGFNDDAFLIL